MNYEIMSILEAANAHKKLGTKNDLRLAQWLFELDGYIKASYNIRVCLADVERNTEKFIKE